ncbi:hypothetical protein [Pseudarthrobacter sp. L1SW]|uniref:hypothetical protein n=1 Tax=Pseudarthrobacter sp. L1SW TaxID=2851598 RepID=UPI001E49CC0F|nr:hypothetical protein [Pseudarthrobacter sp. L1SW]UEL27238.1 hypothetical protein KTR40_11405 [Pseudarthrobacter sp. L1SW]
MNTDAGGGSEWIAPGFAVGRASQAAPAVDGGPGPLPWFCCRNTPRRRGPAGGVY